MRDFQSELLTDFATTDFQELWDKFAGRLEQGIDNLSLQRKLALEMAFHGLDYPHQCYLSLSVENHHI